MRHLQDHHQIRWAAGGQSSQSRTSPQENSETDPSAFSPTHLTGALFLYHIAKNAMDPIHNAHPTAYKTSSNDLEYVFFFWSQRKRRQKGVYPFGNLTICDGKKVKFVYFLLISGNCGCFTLHVSHVYLHCFCLFHVFFALALVVSYFHSFGYLSSFYL